MKDHSNMRALNSFFKKTPKVELDTTILFLSTSVMALSFFLNEMLLSDEITNEEIKKSIPEGLINDTRDYVRKMLEDPHFDEGDQEEKDHTVEYSWPLYMIQAALEKYDLDEEVLTSLHPSRIIGDKTADYSHDLTEMHNALYGMVLNYMEYKKDQMPPLLVIRVYNFVCENEGFEDDKEFREWFPEAIAALPQSEYGAIMNGTYPAP